MVYKKITNLGLFGAAICLSCCSFMTFAAVDSLTTEEFVQYGPEDAYWQFTANCRDGAKRVVQRKTDGNDWCAKGLEGYCDVSREVAADKACGKDFAEAYANSEQVRKAQSDATQAKAQAAAQKRQAESRAAAQRAADQRTREAAERAKAAQQAKIARQAQNQISIDEQLLKIEQEKLELRRQELELEKRVMEIEKSLEADG